jgi:hypothetical protein
MTYTRTLSAVLASAAFCAGSDGSQVACTVPTPTVFLQPSQNADTGESLMMTSFFTTEKPRVAPRSPTSQGVPILVLLRGWRPHVHDPRGSGRHRFVDQQRSFTDYTVSEINLAGTTLNSITEAAANSQLATLGSAVHHRLQPRGHAAAQWLHGRDRA